jgi:hypothetical protein
MRYIAVFGFEVLDLAAQVGNRRLIGSMLSGGALPGLAQLAHLRAQALEFGRSTHLGSIA